MWHIMIMHRCFPRVCFRGVSESGRCSPLDGMQSGLATKLSSNSRTALFSWLQYGTVRCRKVGKKRTIVCVLSIDITDIVGLLVVVVVDCVDVNTDCRKVSGFLHFRKVVINFEELCRAECKGPKQSISPLKTKHKYSWNCKRNIG